jgi:hypothetical protein
MQKPKPQSKQAPFYTTFLHETFLFSNTIQTFLKQLFWWKPTWTRGQNIPWYKDITRSEQKSRWKTKAKRSSRKREHLLNDKSGKLSVLGNEKWSIALSKTNMMWSNHLLQQKKQKKTESKKTTNTPRKMHSAWSNKNIVFWKVSWFLLMKKGCLGGIPKLWCLNLLDISWVDGHPQAWAFVYYSSHLIILQSQHLKTSFIQNLTQFYQQH